MTSSSTPAADHSILVLKSAFAGDPARVRVTGEKVRKQNRYGAIYEHTVIEDLETGRKVSHAKSAIKTYYACSCGRVAFHKVAS
jgi:hypothetical protein